MTAQDRFDNTYVTPHEICQRLRVERSSILYARKRGLLPEPIRLKGSGAFIWERDKIESYLSAWEINLKARRGELK